MACEPVLTSSPVVDTVMQWKVGKNKKGGPISESAPARVGVLTGG
jgi:hypothetical protein